MRIFSVQIAKDKLKFTFIFIINNQFLIQVDRNFIFSTNSIIKL